MVKPKRNREYYTVKISLRAEAHTLLGQAIIGCDSIRNYLKIKVQSFVRDLLIVKGLDSTNELHRQTARDAFESIQAIARSIQQDWGFESPHNQMLITSLTPVTMHETPDSPLDSSTESESYGLGVSPEKVDEINELLP